MYTTIIQISNILYLMHKHHYVYSDLYPGNIGINYVKK